MSAAARQLDCTMMELNGTVVAFNEDALQEQRFVKKWRDTIEGQTTSRDIFCLTVRYSVVQANQLFIQKSYIGSEMAHSELVVSGNNNSTPENPVSLFNLPAVSIYV